MPRLRSELKRYAPKWALDVYKSLTIAREFLADFFDYSASTSALFPKSNSSKRDYREQLQARLTFFTHGLEKGMALPQPKNPFGVERMDLMRSLLESAEQCSVRLESDNAYAAIAEVESFNDTNELSDLLAPIVDQPPVTLPIDAVQSFVKSRHSVRHFDQTRRVSVDQIRQIAQLAGTTPSVCNRQAFRVYYYDDSTQVQDLLRLQNGNRGFNQTIPALMVVTVRRSSFSGPGERNQRWIDGGLFAMSLVWLLHASGLGSCLLNWSETHEKSRTCRPVAGIPASEDIVVFIAVGYPAENYRQTLSPRRDIDDIFVDHSTHATDFSE
ncbi:nitroreductase family protein [Changpingibacter yushuensis]|uniref:nitroreductase family protein n=1 Tax=Changpingibacter yushuensis TaxID=2758440 RepID=UPI0015F47A09|nr:nitroreductase family protein [Changpingibacter yushuensis]